MSSTEYPAEMVYLLEHLSGFSTNTFKIQNSTGNTAYANNVLQFQLPTSTIVNMKSIRLMFNATIGSSVNVGARLPNSTSAFVERYSLEAGGLAIAGGCANYNILEAGMRGIEDRDEDEILSHPEMVRQASYITNATLGALANETYDSAGGACPFCISKWLGVLDTITPSLISTDLLPAMTLTIYLASDNILTKCADNTLALFTSAASLPNASPSYRLDNVHLLVECCNMDDGVYSSMIENSMAIKENGLEIGFQQHLSFQENAGGSVKFNIASNSLDGLLAVHREADYGTVSQPRLVEGFKIADGDNLGGKSSFDSGGTGVYQNSVEKYVPVYFKFKEPTPVAGNKVSFNWTLNSSLIPQFPANSEQMISITNNSLSRPRRNVPLWTRKNSYYSNYIRLNLPSKQDGEVRQQSGINCRGVNLQGYYNIYNQLGTQTVNVFATVGSTLLVSAGKQINVIM